MKTRRNDYILIVTLLLLLGVVSCIPRSQPNEETLQPLTVATKNTPLTTATIGTTAVPLTTTEQATTPAATPTCNAPWPTPPSLACPWLPTPTAEPTSSYPTPTPFIPPPPPDQTPTPLPARTVADSPAGTLFFTSWSETRSSEMDYFSIDSLGQVTGPVAKWTPATQERIDIVRLIASPDYKYLASAFDTEGGEVVITIDLHRRSRAAFASAGQFLGWHPNGSAFLFNQLDNLNEPGLWLVDANLSEHQFLAQNSYMTFDGAAISPDGQILAYSLAGHLVWANADGSDPQPITSTSEAVVFSWSPDGQYLLYGERTYGGSKDPADRGVPPRLWLISRDRQTRKLLNSTWESALTFAAHQPANWSPTGDYVVSVSPLDPTIDYWQKGTDTRDRLYPFKNAGIYVENIETGEVWTIAEHALDPVWSPDGAHLATTRLDAHQQMDLWICEFDGSNPRQVTNTPDFERYPVWAPQEDGK